MSKFSALHRTKSKPQGDITSSQERWLIKTQVLEQRRPLHTVVKDKISMKNNIELPYNPAASTIHSSQEMEKVSPSDGKC